MKPLAASLLLCLAAASAQAQTETLATASSTSNFVFRNGPEGACVGSVIYDTTHASNQGAEITAAANGAATAMGDLITLGGTDRFVCEILIEVFTIAATTPFDLTMTLWTDCTTNGIGNTPCGNGPGTLFPSSTITVTGVTPPALGTIFSVAFPYPNVNLSGEVDNTITVSVNASRSDVFWRLGETVAVGTQPDAGTSFVQRCGSTGTNNGCSRNFGIQNNFAITIEAMSTPVTLQSFDVE
jgi:hypothetical protein